ncbi:unnamed protein product [Prorocentrum cordatum]|nr:unnamed protein product [Polarella glacialis]
MPALGLGTRQLEPGGKCQEAVRAALRAGYRLVDTAAAYGNEEDVGNAVRGAGLRREDVFRAGTRRPRWRRGGAGGPAGLPEASRDELRGSVPGPQPEGRLPAGDVGRDAGDEGEGPGARCGRGELRRGPPAEPRRRRARDARGQPGGAALPEAAPAGGSLRACGRAPHGRVPPRPGPPLRRGDGLGSAGREARALGGRARNPMAMPPFAALYIPKTKDGSRVEANAPFGFSLGAGEMAEIDALDRGFSVSTATKSLALPWEEVAGELSEVSEADVGDARPPRRRKKRRQKGKGKGKGKGSDSKGTGGSKGGGSKGGARQAGGGGRGGGTAAERWSSMLSGLS